MPYGSDPYIGQLHASLDELLDPRVVQACKHMHSSQALRDFVVGWCAASSGSSAVRPSWTWDRGATGPATSGRSSPMHEIEDADSDGERPHPITIAGAPHDQRESGAADDSVSSARCWTAAYNVVFQSPVS